MKQVPFDSDEYLMRFNRKYVFHNLDEELVSWSWMDRKVGSWMQICLLVINWCKNVVFDYFFKCFTLHTLHTTSMEMTNFEFTHNPHTSHKFTQTLTLTLFFLVSKAQLRKWSLRGQNEGLYRHHRWRVTQGSPNKWFITLREHYSTFTLATINSPFWYPSLADG